ncbi:MAG: WYL domain-containing protein [Saprospiraceae bacterium]|nr:WYL domain-containing protein [Saprospiraceae bacterium]
MPEIEKYKRMFQMIDLLRHPGKTKKSLAERFNTSVRTIERDFVDLEREGYMVDKDNAGRHFIFRSIGKGTSVYVTDEESEFLNDLLNKAASEHPLTTPLKTKLFFHAGIGRWSQNYITRNVAEVIQHLTDAMKMNCQVQMEDYYSASTGQLQIKQIEPLLFTDNYKYLIGFDTAANKFVNLKMDRIQKVVLLEAKCTKSPDMVKADVFHMAANEEFHEVELLLTALAARLLVEEHPATERCVEPSGVVAFPFRFRATVHNFLSVGRFCLGLPGQVRVLGPEELNGYLEGRRKGFCGGEGLRHGLSFE